MALCVLVASLVYFNFFAKTNAVSGLQIGDDCPDFTSLQHGGQRGGFNFFFDIRFFNKQFFALPAYGFRRTYQIGDDCPDFTFTTVYDSKGAYNGDEKIDEITISGNKGKVVVLNFIISFFKTSSAKGPCFINEILPSLSTITVIG